MEQDRRRFPRYEVAGLKGGLTTRSEFVVLQLSRGGMLVATDLEPRLGQAVDLDLSFRGSPFRPGGKVIFVGEDRRAPRARRFRVGVAFEGLPPELERTLSDYIEEELEAGGAPSEG
ncbi:MAG TPA: PilZ domain-containing protein [Thermoanaerobaculia bacterium]|nr:PilZ domain-containing protein [Thermoanaerobaculia bacterium]